MNQHELHALVQNYFYDNGQACSDCQFLHSYREPRGEHFGTPCSEIINECALLENENLNVADCPALVDLLDEAKLLTESPELDVDANH